MKEKIKQEINKLEDLYDDYLNKMESPFYSNNYSIFEQRIHDIRIEINTYKKVLEMIENECV